MAANPGAGVRAQRALLRDPARRNVAIAREAGCAGDTVRVVRAQLEQLGVITPDARLPHATRSQGAGQRALAELRRNPRRSLRAIAQAARCAHPTVLLARRELERAAAQRAERAWQAFQAREPGSQLVPCMPGTYPGEEYPRGWPVESQAAVRLCERYCDLLKQCRAWAIAQPPAPGILGGLTQREREAARR